MLLVIAKKQHSQQIESDNRQVEAMILAISLLKLRLNAQLAFGSALRLHPKLEPSIRPLAHY